MIKQNVFIRQAFIALHNALASPELLSALSKFSYNEQKLREAMGRLQALKALMQMHHEAMAKSRLATAQLKQAKDTISALYSIHLDTARLAYKREADYEDYLKICGTRKKATLDWMEQAERFYASVPPAMMEKYHIPQEELVQAQQMVQQLMDLLAVQANAKSKAQHLTQQKLQQMEEMALGMRQFLKIASVALSDSPQQMEALGVVVPS